MIRIPELGLTQFFSKILMRLKQQELEYFRQLYIFNELSRSEVENLHQNAKIIECRRGTVIFRQGDAVNEFFVVRQGDVEISSTCPVSLISEGQLAGEVDVILNDPYRSHTATV
jgi:signal-transduction protein with cAMP-binding, CBS, and nucleotidyltransferase domain